MHANLDFNHFRMNNKDVIPTCFFFTKIIEHLNKQIYCVGKSLLQATTQFTIRISVNTRSWSVFGGGDDGLKNIYFI